ncbi:unnamed protein product [Ascophyllum nodosum]
MYTTAHSFIGFESNNNETYTTVTKTNEEFPGDCIDLDLSNITEIENDSAYYPPRIVFGTYWYLSSENTTVEEQVSQSSESVVVFFTDPDISNPLGDHNMSTFMGSVPFTRQRAGSITTTFLETEVAMTLTESVTLDGEHKKIYSAGTISSQFYEIPDGVTNETFTVDIAFMLMHILQPAFTHTIRREVDPLEWAELIGSIGGTWELLLLLWGIFFIAKRDEPRLKGRDLVKSAKQGAQTIVRGATSIATTSTRRNSSVSPTREEDEVVPAWSTPENAESNRTGDQAPCPPPAFDFSGGQTRQNAFFFTNRAAGGQAQVLRDVNCDSKSSEHGVNRAPSRVVPEVDDIPRPVHRPLF